MTIDQLYPYSILFVEDEAALRENYVTYLKMQFEQVYEAQDGEEAYTLYKAKKPQIMIVDIHIPKLNGLELLRRIRAQDHTTRAIMLTAYTDKPLLLQATELKLTRYLPKPVNRQELTQALHQAIEELASFYVAPIKKIDLSDGYSWDAQDLELRRFGTVVELTQKERRMLELLLSRPNRIFTYDEIYLHVWEYDESPTADALKSLMKNLRKKLPKNCIHNIFATGYKIYM